MRHIPDGKEKELLCSYKHLAISMDDSLTVKPHVLHLMKKLGVKLVVLFIVKTSSALLIVWKKHLLAATF